jgi:hypothetical protein
LKCGAGAGWTRSVGSITYRQGSNNLHIIRRRKANGIGHVLLRDCLLKHISEGKIKGGVQSKERKGRRHKQLLDDLKERRGYWKLK